MSGTRSDVALSAVTDYVRKLGRMCLKTSLRIRERSDPDGVDVFGPLFFIS